MPRPMKPRRIGALPRKRKFVPEGTVREEVVLKLDELEAIRLKDVEGLSQEDAAERMHISRQTYQLILDCGRGKVALALTEGRGIQIDGGNVTINICEYTCEKCGHDFSSEYEKRGGGCPKCGMNDPTCKPNKAYCPKCCMRKNGVLL